MNGLYKRTQGFTLAELLIALGILGVIATFTIPKVLFSAQSGQNTAVAKEAASMVSGAYTSYGLQNGTVATNTTSGAFTSYMNYVAQDTSTATYSFSTACNTANYICLKLHNGAVLQMLGTNNFGGSSTSHSVLYNIDPDGTGTATPATFVLFYNGRLSTLQATGSGNISTGTASTSYTTDPVYIQNWN